MERLFAVTAPGLERLAAAEIAHLGSGGAAPFAGETAGGVEFAGDSRTLYAANLRLRTVSRVLVRLPAFRAAAFPELVRKAARLPWGRFLKPGAAVAIRVTCRASRLYHSEAVAERVLAAISAALGAPSPRVRPADDEEGDPAQLILVRVVDDECAISVDASGALLHRRGYRLAVGKAPLRETLAAGAILASGWDGAAPLVDPFCGSGTIPIEAAWLALGRAPGADRRFAFMGWPCFDPALWASIRADAPPPRDAAAPLILGSDRDVGAIRAALENAARAGVAERIRFEGRAVSALEPPAGPGVVVTNPPYGHRVSGSADLRNLYARLGDVLRERCPGWRVAILCDDVDLLRQTRLDLDESLAFAHGGLKVRVGRGEVG